MKKEEERKFSGEKGPEKKKTAEKPQRG